jgi:hypothetical protein
MADGHGGARTPAKPAPVSGPGKYAKRTDGGPAQVMSAAPDQAYGAQTAQLNQQRVAPMGGSAPMPQAAAAPSGGGAAPQMPAYHGLPFNRPSERPGEPTTHGVDIGPGGGSDVLNLPQPPSPAVGTGRMTALLQNLSATDTTGILAQLYQSAANRNA